jgi:hypothetical protein
MSNVSFLGISFPSPEMKDPLWIILRSYDLDLNLDQSSGTEVKYCSYVFTWPSIQHLRSQNRYIATLLRILHRVSGIEERRWTIEDYGPYLLFPNTTYIT